MSDLSLAHQMFNISFKNERLGMFINRYGPMGEAVEESYFSIIPPAEHNLRILTWFHG